MREIKFRAWEKHNGYMFDCDVISGDKGYPDWESFDDGVPSSKILMQFTGIKDKNGKDIYEGDILQIKVNGINKGREEVKFLGYKWYPFGEGIPTDYAGTELEIIGNIYQKPEK